MKVVVTKSYDESCAYVADMICKLVNEKPACKLGLATGGTPVGTYKQLVEWYNKGDLDFSEVTTVNLDEYRGLPRENRGRNHAHNVPGIPLAASAAPRGDQGIISFAHERAVGDFIEEIAVFKIVHSRNAVLKVAVYVGYFQRVIAVYAPRGAVLAHARQGNHLPGAPVVLL